MGCVTSLCSKAGSQGTFPGFGEPPKEGDESTLLKPVTPGDDVAFHVSSTPTPLLKDVNFAAIDDNDDPDDSTETSVDDDKIERMLREEEDEPEPQVE